MNFNDLNFHIKKEEIKERFEEILNFYKNNYVFMSKSNFFDENKSINDSPSKKGLSRTLFKRPATISVFKVAEKKPRNSFNKNSEGN